MSLSLATSRNPWQSLEDARAAALQPMAVTLQAWARAVVTTRRFRKMKVNKANHRRLNLHKSASPLFFLPSIKPTQPNLIV